jgi:hypothetical protein
LEPKDKQIFIKKKKKQSQNEPETETVGMGEESLDRKMWSMVTFSRNNSRRVN